MIKNISEKTRFPRIGKIRLGTKKQGNKPGKNTDYFRLESTMLPQEMIDEHVGVNPKEIICHFQPFLHLGEEVFDHNFVAYAKGKKICQGNGETANRVVNGELQEIDCTCPWLEDKKCKQRGELKLVISGLPFGYWTVGTSSWSSIGAIDEVLTMFKMNLGDAFYRTRFVIYKEKVTLRGYQQDIMKIKIHPDDVAILRSKMVIDADIKMNLFVHEDEDEKTETTAQQSKVEVPKTEPKEDKEQTEVEIPTEDVPASPVATPVEKKPDPVKEIDEAQAAYEATMEMDALGFTEADKFIKEINDMSLNDALDMVHVISDMELVKAVSERGRLKKVKKLAKDIIDAQNSPVASEEVKETPQPVLVEIEDDNARKVLKMKANRTFIQFINLAVEKGGDNWSGATADMWLQVLTGIVAPPDKPIINYMSNELIEASMKTANENVARLKKGEKLEPFIPF